MQSTASNLEFKLNVDLRLVKPDFMQSTAVNLEFKLKVIFKLLSCNRPLVFTFIMPLIFSRYTVLINNYRTLYMVHSIPLALFHDIEL